MWLHSSQLWIFVKHKPRISPGRHVTTELPSQVSEPRLSPAKFDSELSRCGRNIFISRKLLFSLQLVVVSTLALLWYYYVKECGGRIFCVGILISQQRCSFTICTIIGWVIFHFLTIIVLQYCQWPGGMWSCLFVLCENNSRVLILMKIFECPLIWQTCHRNSLNPS